MLSTNHMPQSKAPQACLSCRIKKRKCDKELPSCTLCRRMDRPCDYSEPTSRNGSDGSDDLTYLKNRMQELERRLVENTPVHVPVNHHSSTSESSSPGLGLSNSPWVRSSVTSCSQDQQCPPAQASFPAMFFLDLEAYNTTQASIQRPVLSVPQEMIAILGGDYNVQSVLEVFFRTIHTWLPVVSRKRIYQLYTRAEGDLSADMALLLTTMKLICTVPDYGTPGMMTPLYWMAKQFSTRIETCGLLSVQTLQAGILISAYELGHSIYPAAYLSIGQCSRLGQGMGLHDRQKSPQIYKNLRTWTEDEELRRAWYAVLILDRYLL